jgi:hypothetical protein
MNAMLLYYHRTLAQQRQMIREAHWELYDFCVNRQDRKQTIRNIVDIGFPARDAIEMVRDCEQEG